jgi:hypothetical protein
MKLFVYYKFLPLEQPDIKARVEGMQVKLQNTFTALNAQLLRRPKPDELGQVTWMEIYDVSLADFDAFSTELERVAKEAKLPCPRRNEQFINC